MPTPVASARAAGRSGGVPAPPGARPSGELHMRVWVSGPVRQGQVRHLPGCEALLPRGPHGQGAGGLRGDPRQAQRAAGERRTRRGPAWEEGHRHPGPAGSSRVHVACGSPHPSPRLGAARSRRQAGLEGSPGKAVPGGRPGAHVGFHMQPHFAGRAREDGLAGCRDAR